jgi:hypothetical protein
MISVMPGPALDTSKGEGITMCQGGIRKLPGRVQEVRGGTMTGAVHLLIFFALVISCRSLVDANVIAAGCGDGWKGR